MSRVLTFSRTYPSYHPKAGQPTYFVEKIIGGLVAADVRGYGTELIKSLRDSGLLSIAALNELHKGTYSHYKHHTIRAGHRWKAGDWFSPRVWSGKPYNSKQIQFAPDIQVKKVFDFEMLPAAWRDECQFMVNGRLVFFSVPDIAMNDGLTLDDFVAWFAGPDMMSSKRKPFDGQIICWNEAIEY